MSRSHAGPVYGFVASFLLLFSSPAVCGEAPPTFLRSDCNQDQRFDASDPIFLLLYLFNGGRRPLCEDACDVNDVGRIIDISDAIYMLQFLFNGGQQPRPPYPEPGIDPTEDSLDCVGEPDFQWVNTSENNALDTDDTLFRSFVVNDSLAYGTESELTNIHSHYLSGTPHRITGFSGRFRQENQHGSIGVTFLSDYPDTDSYYRLRSARGGEFVIAPHPHGKEMSGGTTNSGVWSDPNTWFRFEVALSYTPTQTRIRAMVWPEELDRPATWQIDCYDDQPNRLTRGRVGCWSMGPGQKFWDEFLVDRTPVAFPALLDVGLPSSSVLRTGQTRSLNVRYWADSASTGTDVTSQVSLTSSNPQAVAVETAEDGKQVLRGLEAGVAVIRATFDGIEAPPATVRVFSGEPTEDAEWVRSVTRYGITWTFDREYLAGSFVNGDPWVMGPATIVDIDPRPQTDGTGRVLNGSEINPRGGSRSQGFDSAARLGYDRNRNVARNLSAANPLVLQPGQSLISTDSVSEVEALPQIHEAEILTCLAEPPPANSFRPAYAGDDKSIRFTSLQIRWELLRRLAKPDGTPPMENVERRFRRPWIDHVLGWTARYVHPQVNMPDYGRDMSHDVGLASQMLHLDFTEAEKENLLLGFLQLGIDLHGIAINGGEETWLNDGGHSSGRKWPILFAGLMLDDPAMKSIGQNTEIHFGEDDQTFFVRETSPGVYNNGHGGYDAGDVGLPDWGITHASRPSRDDKSFGASYRVCCTALSWGGWVLAVHIMDAQDLWNHDALFDYQDRYMFRVEGPGYPRTWRSEFTSSMWDTYRSQFGGREWRP
ncbi:MAG: Ig-like domain-containing protein [Planctomycetota bacterium]